MKELRWHRGVRCHLCRTVIEQEHVSRDHKRPRSMGGTVVLPAHARCNNARGNLPWDITRAVVRKLGPTATPNEVRAALRLALQEWRDQQKREAGQWPMTPRNRNRRPSWATP